MSDTPSPPPADDSAALPDEEWEALARHLAGEGTAAQAAAVTTWLESHPEDAALVASLDALASPTADPPARPGRASLWEPTRPIDTERALQTVKASLAATAPAATPQRRPRIGQAARRPNRAGWAVVALAAAAAIVIAELPRRAVNGRSDAVDMLAAGATLATPVGRVDSTRLPDGTRVILAPESRMTLDADFGAAHATRRGMTLEGEAWVAAAHDPARPLEIRAGGARIRDVGTTFTVRTSDAQRGVTVTVSEGIVALGHASAARAGDVVLRAGDRGSIRGDSAPRAERGVVTDDDAAWTRGELVYRDAPLARVQGDLRRWYGIDLQVADSSLATQRLTATFAHEPSERVLDMIATALGARVERNGAIATLHASSVGATPPAPAPAATPR